jgi:hypothetical protein
MKVLFRINHPLPSLAFGPLSPLRAIDDVEMTFEFEHFDSFSALLKLFRKGIIPSVDVFPDLQRFDQYLDIPIVTQVINGDLEKQGDANLWLYKMRGYHQYSGLCADECAKRGHLETLKWIRANGGQWTSWAADGAAQNGHLETLKWIRANGGEWTNWAADWAAMNGHLETLKWIRANGGEWTEWAANWAAENGHLETLKWIRANEGEWRRMDLLGG